MGLIQNIPLELRLLIYVFYLQDASIHFHIQQCMCNRKRSPSGLKTTDGRKLLLICHQLRDEAEPLAYRHAQFVKGICIQDDLEFRLGHAWLRIRKLFLDGHLFERPTNVSENWRWGYLSGRTEQPWRYELILADQLSSAILDGKLQYLELNDPFDLSCDHDRKKFRSIVDFLRDKTITTKIGLTLTYTVMNFYDTHDQGLWDTSTPTFVTIAKTYDVKLNVPKGSRPDTTALEQVFKHAYSSLEWKRTRFKVEEYA